MKQRNGYPYNEDSNFEEPNFDELNFDKPAYEKLVVDAKLDMASCEDCSGSDSFKAEAQLRNDTRAEEDRQIAASESPRSLSPNTRSEAELLGPSDKYAWPRLCRLLEELRHSTPNDQQGWIKLSLGSFYVRAPNICRLRLSENKVHFTAEGKTDHLINYRSRVVHHTGRIR